LSTIHDIAAVIEATEIGEVDAQELKAEGTITEFIVSLSPHKAPEAPYLHPEVAAFNPYPLTREQSVGYLLSR